MNPDDPLWHLLGRAKQPEVSAFFARNVLREIREQKSRGRLAWLRGWRVAIPVGAAAMVTVLSIGVMQHPKQNSNAKIAQLAGNPDYDVINHLDELVASEENSIWLENSGE